MPYDANIQVRLHRSTLATLALFYHNKGHMMRNTGELVRTSLEDFKDALVLQGHIDPVAEAAKASEILERLSLGTGQRTERQFLTNLQLDEFTREGIRPQHKGNKLVGGTLKMPSYEMQEEPQLDVIRNIPDNIVVEGDDEDGKSKEESTGKGNDS